MKLSRRTVFSALLALVVLGLAGWLLLVNPDNPLTRIFSNRISDIDARVVIGPYPLEDDFRRLKAAKVGLVVSLLDPDIPYEGVLLKEEKDRAGRFGLFLKNFPMSSVLGRRFGGDYDRNASGAAEAIAAFPGKVYFHCYLGIHRIQVVKDLLKQQGIEAGRYTVRKGERGKKALALDEAEAAFDQGRYGEALDLLAKLGGNDLTPDALLLRAWSYYRMGRVPEARSTFENFLASSPGHVSANTGLGYCLMREADLAGAERAFGEALAKEPANPDALGGLGLALFRSGRLEEAAEKIEASLRIAPNAELQSVLDKIRAGD